MTPAVMSPAVPAVVSAEHRAARLLVIDDEQPNLDLLAKVLARAGYEQVTLTTDARWALEHLDALAPDILLLDLHMPTLDGFEVLRRLQEVVGPQDLLPRLVITADSTAATRRTALALGAHDFLTKPIDVTETTLRVANLLRTRLLHVQLRQHNAGLERLVQARTAQLEASHRELTRRLALVGEYSDDDTAAHTVRVGQVARQLAEALGWGPVAADLIAEAAPLHDLGKVAIPDAILLKRGPLSEEEFGVVKTHAAVGAHILAGGQSELLRLAEQIAFTHHERWDGSGYPRGLAGVDIPQAGRVVAVVDVYDALTSRRPYKHAWPVERAVAEMRSQRGRHFDPEVLDVFLTLDGLG
ncbi:MAG TPA: HD domain-containing phosphohydrolase [Mycobacteriales bacterium]|nr:HD domain-containing phosphohydrolase [Mycobacteriales bacterium]